LSPQLAARGLECKYKDLFISRYTPTVIPAKAGIPLLLLTGQGSGIPAFAGMTDWE
jgi:hypothetical protein